LSKIIFYHRGTEDTERTFFIWRGGTRQIKRLSALPGNETKGYFRRTKFFFDRYLPIEEKISHSVPSVSPW
jgi:hypothetical protein